MLRNKNIKDNELATRVLKALQITDINDSSKAFRIIITSLSSLLKSTGVSDVATLIKLTNFNPLKSLEGLSKEDIITIEELVKEKKETVTPQDIFDSQIEVSRLISPMSRKMLAAYYTKSIGVKLMSSVLRHYNEICNHPLVLCDPFLGSGLTLSESIKVLPRSNIIKVWGVELHPLSSLVAYAAIVHSLKGDHQKVNVIVGDSFKIIYEKLSSLMGFIDNQSQDVPKVDVILTNPPFTRWELLNKEYRTFLTKFIKLLGYDKYVTRKQQNLQLISLFLMDFLLKKSGLLISVLPASTFYTIYGEAAKTLLKDRFQINALVECSFDPSFSIDSGFKEVILIATKTKSNLPTAFLSLEKDDVNKIERLGAIIKDGSLIDKNINWVDIAKIPYPWNMNWLTLFGQNPLRDLVSVIFSEATKKGMVNTLVKVIGKKQIVRGIEMYGPDFFLIPNKYWKIVDINKERAVIENQEKMRLQIDREFIIPTLRRPKLYTDSIIPSVEHNFLSIPPKPKSELPQDVLKYIEWGESSSTAQSAMKAFGEFWYSHIYKQINIKKPFGHVFLPDKVDPSFRNRGVFACYYDIPLAASKNFYIITLNDELKNKALCLWFNSSLFIAYFIVASRKISEGWTRFLEEDYLRMPILNVNLLNSDALQRLANSFDIIAQRKLEPFHLQLGKNYRLEIDEILLKIIGIENSSMIAYKLHSLIDKFLNKKEVMK